MAQRCMEEIFSADHRGDEQGGRPFKGLPLFRSDAHGRRPKVIEYNARFGDPKTQVVLPRLKTDLLDIVDAVVDERLEELEIEWSTARRPAWSWLPAAIRAAIPEGIEDHRAGRGGQVSGRPFITPAPPFRTADSTQRAAACSA